MADVTFERFGGLNLVQDPQEAGAEQALSCANVSLERNGRLRSRDGYGTLYTAAAENFVSALHPVSTGVVLAADGSKVRVVDLGAGTSAANVTIGTASSSFASAGSAVYFTDSTTTQIRKYTGGAFSSPAGLAAYKGNFLAVQPLEDRLVIADANSTSKLWFSDPGTPETIAAANFLELTPGDGERITGMCVFGTELFVFKKTKFFVFYGNSTDSTGGSIFNYRMVDVGVGCDEGNFTSGRLVCAHETGVYFVGYDGVYRTTGGAPVMVSTPIRPVFKAANIPVPAPFSSVVSSPVIVWRHLGVATDRLYAMGLAGSSTQVQFVMELATGEWTCYLLSASSVLDGARVADTTDSANYRGSTILGGRTESALDAVILKMSASYADDNGAAISWHHQSGFYDLGSQHSKRTRETVLWGSGTPTVSIFTDHGTTDSNAGSVTLGTAPAVARGWHSKAYEGVLFSHKISGSGPATIHRIGHQVADERVGR